MTCGSPNTSEQSRWQTVEATLLASLRCQPLLIVIRPERSDFEGEDSERGDGLEVCASQYTLEEWNGGMSNWDGQAHAGKGAGWGEVA